MDKKIIKFVTFVLIILIVVKCTDDEIPTKEFPGVKTLEVNNITNLGATFNAEIIRQGNQDIFEYGFVWGKEDNPTVELNEKLSITNILTSSKFSAQIESTLKDGNMYYVRAYSKSNDYLVYGNIVEFLSLGSGAAKINDFYPKLGTWGDTITLVGKNFSYIKDHNQVFFEDIASKVISSTDSTIVSIVPDDVSEKSVPISLKIEDQITESNDNFEFIVPEIESFSPLKGTFGDIITFTVSNLDPINNKISFDGYPAQILESTETTLSVIVPNTLETRFNNVEITLKSISNPAKEQFELLAPIINGFSPESARPYNLLKISGDNFNPDKRRNIVILDSNNSEVIEASNNELTVKVPNSIYSNRSFKVKVIVAGQEGYSDSMFSINIPWLKKENIPIDGNSRYRATGFSLLNYGYLGLGISSGIVRGDFFKYDPILNTWEKIPDFSGEKRIDATSFVIGDYAYVGTGRTSNNSGTDNLTNDFWRFDPQSNTWTEITSFPIKTRDAIGLSVNGKGYVITLDNSSNFWSYDPVLNEWSQMPNLDIDSFNGIGIAKTGFVVNEKIYIVTNRDQYSSLQEIFEFDTNTLQWSRKTDAHNSYFSGDSFAIKNKGYLISKYTIDEYNPLTDSWIEYWGFPGDHRKEGVEFVIGDKAYYGSGFNDEPDFWEYSQEFDQVKD